MQATIHFQPWIGRTVEACCEGSIWMAFSEGIGSRVDALWSETDEDEDEGEDSFGSGPLSVMSVLSFTIIPCES